MRIGILLLIVSALTQGCKIEMPPIATILGGYRMFSPVRRAPYDFSKSKAIAHLGGFKDTLIVGDEEESGHGMQMLLVITDTKVPKENVVFFDNIGSYGGEFKEIDKGLRMLGMEEWRFLRDAARVIHTPTSASYNRDEDPAAVASFENVVFVRAAGNRYSFPGGERIDRGRDPYNPNYSGRNDKDDPERNAWLQGLYQNLLTSHATGKVIAATSAEVTEEGVVEPNLSVQTCGDIKEHCFAIIPEQATSHASSRLAAMTFYLSQLYETEEEVREVFEVCAVDVGEPGIDREYGRGLANLLCPRVLEREIEIVSEHSDTRDTPGQRQGGELTGTWRAANSTLEVSLPAVLRETAQIAHKGTTNGTISFKEDRVTANIALQAAIDVFFLTRVTATAEDRIRVQGGYEVEDTAVTFGERAFTYTATKDSLFMTRSYTLYEILQLLPTPLGEMADTIIDKNLFADNPITITTKFAKALLADFDNNNVVDMVDFLLFVEAFGTSEGDEKFNSHMDLNADGVINITDFLIFASLFEQTE